MTRPADQEIDRTIRSILERDEFRGIDQSGGAEVQAIGELVTAVLQAVEAFIGDLRTNHPALFVLLLVAGTAVLATAVWYGARGAARRAYADAAVGGEIPEDLRGDPATLRRDAERAAAEGRYLDAVRLLFRAEIIDQALREGSLESLREAGRFRRAHTYRELVEEFSRSSEALERMRRLAERIEQGLYAGDALGPADWLDAQRIRRA